jgi:hypothetical protein
MRMAKQDIPTQLDIPGATARQAAGFGAGSPGAMGAEWFSLAAGTDMAPLLQGLQDDACQAPHWGYVIQGRVVASYTDGSAEICVTGDVFHWPAGHSIRVEEDAELILFSPHHDHAVVIDHVREKLGASA